MSFKLTKVIGDSPVDKENEVSTSINSDKREYKSALGFNDVISSEKGLISRWCYCARIVNTFEGSETREPIVRVLGNEFIHLEKTN